MNQANPNTEPAILETIQALDHNQLLRLELSDTRKQLLEASVKYEKLKKFLSELKLNIDGAIDHV